MDYASEDTKKIGEALIQAELENIPKEKVKEICKENLEKIEQGMMTESRKTGGDATDIYQIIRFHHDEAGSDDGLLHLTVEQVELHPFLQDIPEIGMVDMILLILQLHEIFLLIGILVDVHTDEISVPVLHDASDTAVVDFQSLLIRSGSMRNEYVEFVGNIHSEDC